MTQEAMQSNTKNVATRRIDAPSENRKSRSSTKSFAKTIGTMLLILLTVFLNIVHTTSGVCYAVNTAKYAVPTAKAAAYAADKPYCRSHGGQDHTRYMIHYANNKTLKEKDFDARNFYFYSSSFERNATREEVKIKKDLCPENEQKIISQKWHPYNTLKRALLPYSSDVEVAINAQKDINGEHRKKLETKKKGETCPRTGTQSIFSVKTQTQRTFAEKSIVPLGKLTKSHHAIPKRFMNCSPERQNQNDADTLKLHNPFKTLHHVQTQFYYQQPILTERPVKTEEPLGNFFKRHRNGYKLTNREQKPDSKQQNKTMAPKRGQEVMNATIAIDTTVTKDTAVIQSKETVEEVKSTVAESTNVEQPTTANAVDQNHILQLNILSVKAAEALEIERARLHSFVQDQMRAPAE